eukprot:TRINITY_DN6593_c0_g1_i2.p1 TRINITY_DN6593_c0_g1~~TRINITY_DN6593_c0_g1_i2.p1  ORF type:complete len:194 (-),score=33.95 TRINITY_DN6593_c0_g1_i2:187-732(-)
MVLRDKCLTVAMGAGSYATSVLMPVAIALVMFKDFTGCDAYRSETQGREGDPAQDAGQLVADNPCERAKSGNQLETLTYVELLNLWQSNKEALNECLGQYYEEFDNLMERLRLKKTSELSDAKHLLKDFPEDKHLASPTLLNEEPREENDLRHWLHVMQTLKYLQNVDEQKKKLEAEQPVN